MCSRFLCVLLLVGVISYAAVAGADTVAQFAAVRVRAPDDPNVNGFRFSFLYGGNEKMTGIDFGLLAMSESDELAGVAFVLGIHKLNQNMSGGATFSLINLHGGDDFGLNVAFINKVNSATGAVDFGLVNIAEGTTLVDVGGFNMAKASTAQFGFINMTDEIKGFQIGFLNFAQNGFLPVFPFFNFPKQ